MADVEVRTNLPDFKRQLSRFTDKVEKQIVGSAANAAAQVFKKAVIAATPVLRQADPRRIAGTLQRAIYVFRRRSPASGTVSYRVSFRQGKKTAKGGRDAFYGRFLETGWVPRGPGKRLRGGARAKSAARGRAAKAGAKRIAYPFLLPGFQAAKDAALAAFNAKMQQRIDKANREGK